MPDENLFHPLHPRGSPSDTEFAAGRKVGGGRYALIRRLGRGGMGIVWLAQDERLNEQVALKFLPPQISADPGALDDLRRETLRSRKLTHPNIVRIHDLFESQDELPFISMEFVDGPSLVTLRVEAVASAPVSPRSPLAPGYIRGAQSRARSGRR